MGRLLKTTVGLIVGAVSGGVLAAIVLAVPTYLDKGCGPLGCVKDWAILGIYIGLGLGGLTGALIGLVVGISSLSKSKGAAVGAVVGSIIMVVLFVMGAGGDTLVSAWAVLSVPTGALVGLIASTFVGFLSGSGTRSLHHADTI